LGDNVGGEMRAEKANIKKQKPFSARIFSSLKNNHKKNPSFDYD